MHWCFGFAGLFGLFGLIGVAFAIEVAARRKAEIPRKEKRPVKSWLHKTGISIAVALVVALIVKTFFCEAFVAITDSAAPELPRGSRVIAWKLANAFVPGDLIVYKLDGKANLGRVVADEGTNLLVNRNGKADAAVARDTVVGKVICVYWRASASKPADSGQIDIAKNPGGPWLAKLPQGEIELVAIARHPSAGQAWWRPDRSPYTEKPFENPRGRFTVNDPMMEHREFVFRLPKDASLQSRDSEPAGAWGGSGVPESDGRPMYAYRYLLAAFPRTASTANFHVAVASGDWTTIYHHEPAGSHSSQGRHGDGTQWTVSFTPAVENVDGSTVVNVAYSPGEQDTRVLAVDNGGQEHTASRTEGSIVGDARQLASTFQNLPLKQIKEFRFQVRPYQLVEFRNVAIQPQAGSAATSAAGGEPTAKSEVPWGEWNADWSVRLRTEKTTWTTDEMPVFTVDLRKREEEDEALRSLNDWVLEVDGRRFQIGDGKPVTEEMRRLQDKRKFQAGTTAEAFATFGFNRQAGVGGMAGMGGGQPGQTMLHTRRARQDIWIVEYWLSDEPQAAYGGPFQWTAGKHVVRIAFPTNPQAMNEQSRWLAFSNPVNVQIEEKINGGETSASFGPVNERIITTDEADDQGLVFFQMQTGKVMKPPFRLKLTNSLPHVVELTPELKQWIRANDMDLLFYLDKKGIWRMNLEMVENVAFQLSDWATVTPDKASAALARADAMNTVQPFVPASEGVRNYSPPQFGAFAAFRTRNKTIGVYQFTGVQADTRRGVRIRYKLIQVAGDKVAKSPPVVEHPAKAAGTEAPTLCPMIGDTGQTRASAHTAKTDAELAAIDHDVELLCLTGPEIADNSLVYLEKLGKLRSLQLDHTPVTDAGLKHVKTMNSLAHLSLAYTQVTDSGLKYLAGCSRLKTLSLNGDKISDAGLEHLKGLNQLSWLFLDDTQVSDAGVKSLEALGQLERVSLNRTKIDDAGLERLARLAHLQSLHLWGTKITDAGLGHVRELSHLESLSLGDTKVSDTGLASLKGLSQLDTLYLAQTSVTDAGLEQLVGLTKLESLVLTGTKVTDAGLDCLKGLKSLQSLDVRNSMVTTAGVKQLQQALPNCKIERGHDHCRKQPPRLSVMSVFPVRK